MDLALKIFMAILGLVSVSAAVYNVLTARAHSKQGAQEASAAARLEANIVLAHRTEQRVTSLEDRHNHLEARVERRLDQIGGDVGKVKDMFTDYLIKNH
jgi:hypothetical protein